MNQEELGGLCTTDTVKVCSKKSKDFLIDSLLANDFQPKSFTSHDSANQEPPFFPEADSEDVQDRDNDSSGMYFPVLRHICQSTGSKSGRCGGASRVTYVTILTLLKRRSLLSHDFLWLINRVKCWGMFTVYVARNLDERRFFRPEMRFLDVLGFMKNVN